MIHLSFRTACLWSTRRRFFAASGFDQDGGYKKSLFWLGLKWFRVPVPNTTGGYQKQ